MAAVATSLWLKNSLRWAWMRTSLRFLSRSVSLHPPLLTFSLFQNDGNTALHFAATHGHEGVCNTLLDCGANPDAKNSLGNSALHCAASSGNMDIVSLLVEKGQADIALQQNNGCTPLHFAAKEGNGNPQSLSKSLL